MKYSILLGALASGAVLLGSASQSSALVTSPSSLLPAAESTDVAVAVRGGFRGGGGAVRGRAVGVGRVGAVGVRRVGVGAVGVRRVGVGAVGVRRGAAVVGYRRWVRRPYFGTVVGGIVLGSIVTAAVVGTAPVAPAPGLCWYWADPSGTRGYWDYC
jgi:hypothetical protein